MVISDIYHDIEYYVENRVLESLQVIERHGYMKLVQKRWRITALWAACMLAVSGCAAKSGESDLTRVVLTTGFAQDEIFRIEKLSCTLPEMMVYLTNMKNQYESVYGDRIWQASYEGETLEGNIKETVLARVAKIKAMNLLAEEKDIALDEEELDKASRAAAEYYQSLSEEEVRELGVTQNLIRQMYEEYALAGKVYEYLIADINPEISDDEARTITVQDILIKTYSLNENGERVPYSTQAKQEAYRRAVEAQQKAVAGEDFTSLIAEYNEDANSTYSFGKGTYNDAFEEAAFNLGTDEISGVVETAYGYHIIKCISTFDRDETDRNKIKIVEQRRKEVFEEQYSAFVDGLTRNMNTKLWDEVRFLDDENVTTDNFFEVYQSYF